MITINVMSSKDIHEERIMNSNSDSIKIIFDKADEVIKKLSKSLLSKYQIGLQVSMKESGFIFDYVDLLQCKCYKINKKCSRSYRVSGFD